MHLDIIDLHPNLLIVFNAKNLPVTDASLPLEMLKGVVTVKILIKLLIMNVFAKMDFIMLKANALLVTLHALIVQDLQILNVINVLLLLLLNKVINVYPLAKRGSIRIHLPLIVFQ